MSICLSVGGSSFQLRPTPVKSTEIFFFGVLILRVLVQVVLLVVLPTKSLRIFRSQRFVCCTAKVSLPILDLCEELPVLTFLHCCAERLEVTVPPAVPSKVRVDSRIVGHINVLVVQLTTPVLDFDLRLVDLLPLEECVAFRFQNLEDVSVVRR